MGVTVGTSLRGRSIIEKRRRRVFCAAEDPGIGVQRQSCRARVQLEEAIRLARPVWAWGPGPYPTPDGKQALERRGRASGGASAWCLLADLIGVCEQPRGSAPDGARDC